MAVVPVVTMAVLVVTVVVVPVVTMAVLAVTAVAAVLAAVNNQGNAFQSTTWKKMMKQRNIKRRILGTTAVLTIAGGIAAIDVKSAQANTGCMIRCGADNTFISEFRGNCGGARYCMCLPVVVLVSCIMLASLVVNRPKSAIKLLEKQAFYKFQNKDYQGAIDCYNKAILLKPDNANYYYHRSEMYKKLGTQRALKNSTQAMCLEPNDRFYYKVRDNVYKKRFNSQPHLLAGSETAI